MGVRDLVNKFTSGELDPRFLAEVDFDGYRKSGRKLRNVTVSPQGSAQRRFGTIWQVTIMNGVIPVTDPTHVRLIEYEHMNNEFYDIIIREDSASVVAFDIYLSGVFQVRVPAPAATYTQAMIRQIRWVKDYDRIILLHSSVPPQQLRRITANNWTLTQLDFQYFPTYDFSYEDDPATLPTPNTPYWSAGVTFTPNAMAATTVTASTAVYTSNHVGGLIYGNSGIFRITAIDATGTIATGFVLEDFADTSAIMGSLVSLNERAWNDGAPIAGAPAGIVRGWPSHGNFYQSRLVLGNSPALPGIAYASNVKEYQNFDDSLPLPNNAWGVELGATGNDFITDIISAKSLILLGNKGPSSTSILLNEATTPTNNFLNTQGSEGSRNMNGIFVDNQIIYADTAGNTMWSMSYEIPDTGYNIINASILSTQLIRDPQWADLFDPSDIDGRYYLLVNADGTLAIYNTIKDENIKAWTLAKTLGSFIDVGCAANQAKVLTLRQINTGSAVILGALQGVYTVDSTFNAFRDITANINIATPSPVFTTDDSYIVIGNEIQFTAIALNFATPASANLALTFEFLTLDGQGNQAWELFTPADLTNGFSNNGNINWNQIDVSNWEAQTLTNTTPVYNDLPDYFWIRIRRTNPTATPPLVIPIINTMFINIQNSISMEQLNFSYVMDSTITTSSDISGNVNGLTQLAGQDAFLFSNGFPLGIYYIDDTGTVIVPTITKNIPPLSVITVGLDFTVNVTPMPVIALMQNGVSVYEPAHVEYLYVDYYQSLGITIQGQAIPQISPDVFLTESIPQVTSGYYKQPSYNGWDPRVEFEISQSYPAPMTILAVSYTIEVSP